MEAWRYWALGGMDGYLAWWSIEVQAVSRQSGVSAGYMDTPGMTDKLATHLRMLAEMFGLSPTLAALWILGPPTILAAMRLGGRKPSAIEIRTLWLPVLVALAYFAWWLLVSPTQKAWHRRILVGAVLCNFSWVCVAAYCAHLSRQWRSHAAKWAGSLPIAFCLFLLATFAFTWAWATPSKRSPADYWATVHALQALPPDSVLLAVGWRSSPSLSLMSGRNFLDANDVLLHTLSGREHVYLVSDRSPPHPAAMRIIQTYRATPLLPANQSATIHALDISTPNPTFLGSYPAPAPTQMVMASDNRMYFRGFNPSSKPGMWMTSDAFVVLQYRAGADLVVHSWLPRLDSYTGKGPFSILASVDGCDVGAFALAKGGRHELRFDPSGCRLANGKDVVVRLSSGDLVDSPITRDDRALSLIVTEIGFSAPTPPKGG